MHKHIITGLLMLLIVFTACTKKKTEQEYFQMAYDQYNKEQFTEAINNFEKVLEYYPHGTNAPKAMFMIGFIHANNTKNYDEAKKYYTMFIEKYPQHELVNSAEYELKNLGQDVNQLPMFHDAEKDTVASGGQK
jgi:outer membrane protein assembly factor BamD (BamD/ComL family)